MINIHKSAVKSIDGVFLLLVPTIKPATEALEVLLGKSLGEVTHAILTLWNAGSVLIVFFWYLLAAWKRQKVISAATVIVALFGLSLCFSTYLTSGVKLGIFLEFGTLVMFFMLADLYQGKRFLRYLEALYAYISLIMLINSVTMFVYYPRIYNSSNSYYLYGLDNMTFMYAIVGCFLGLVLCELREKRFRWRFVVIYVFILSAYFYNFAGTAVVIVAALLFAIPLYKAKMLNVLNYRVALLGCIVSFAFIVGFQTLSVFTKILSLIGKNATFTGRTFIWARMFALLPRYWLIGIGADDSVAVDMIFIGHLHNVVLEFLFKGGVVALFLFALLWVFCYRNMMKFKTCPVAVLLCLEMILLWLTCMFEFRFNTFTFWLIPICLYRIQDLAMCYDDAKQIGHIGRSAMRRGHHVPNRKLPEKH